MSGLSSSLASQVNGFIKKAEDREKEIASVNTEVDSLCSTMLTMLCVIGAASPGGLTADHVKKISVPVESAGSISRRVEYLKKGFSIVSGVVHEYGSLTSQLAGVSPLASDSPGQTPAKTTVASALVTVREKTDSPLTASMRKADKEDEEKHERADPRPSVTFERLKPRSPEDEMETKNRDNRARREKVYRRQGHKSPVKPSKRRGWFG